jgi:hypothetical protein
MHMWAACVCLLVVVTVLEHTCAVEMVCAGSGVGSLVVSALSLAIVHLAWLRVCRTVSLVSQGLQYSLGFISARQSSADAL